ncbi:MAG: hypothetical protein IKB42_01935 [Clostridia bacterium]|nr:hypothetical protein [Clostridia bacterium]
MTHNRAFIKNLLGGLNKNKKLYFEKAFASDKAYKSFMNGLANAIYKKLGMPEIDLPLIYVESDHKKSTPFIIVLHEFNNAFIVERYDAYYAAVFIDDDGKIKLFTYELDYDKDDALMYVCCEYFEDGTRKVYSSRKRLHLDAFCAEISKAINV